MEVSSATAGVFVVGVVCKGEARKGLGGSSYVHLLASICNSSSLALSCARLL